MTAAIIAHTLDAPAVTITYDVRGTLGEGIPLLLIGSPMAAEGFTTLGGRFTDRPVVTYDPRGTGRSTRTEGHGEITPDHHAGDLQPGRRGDRLRAGRRACQQRRRGSRAVRPAGRGRR
jgi:pimeloyl-ACP methyl ester carboxylesterase